MKRSSKEAELDEENKIQMTPSPKKQRQDDYFQTSIKDISNWTIEEASIDVMILWMPRARFITKAQKSVIEAIAMDAAGDKIKIVAWEEDGLRLQRFKKMDGLKIKSFRVRKTDPRYRYFHQHFIGVGFKSNLIPLFGQASRTLKEAFKNHWNFQTIKQARRCAENTLVDVAGVLIRDESLQYVAALDANKRIIHIMDQTSVMQVTLWNVQAEMSLEERDIVAIASGKVSSFNNGSFSSVGLIMRNPNCSMCENLKTWMTKLCDNNSYETVIQKMRLDDEVSKLKTFTEIQNMQFLMY